ncbi:IS1 family transposase ISNisp5 [subsurface metagenome]
MVSMNKLTIQKRVQVLGALVEGNSIRSTVRMTGAAKNTVVKLLQDIGQVCELYQRKNMVNLPCKRLQVDEIWSFCYSKQKNIPEQYQGMFVYGDVWTWVAMDAETKLVPTWLIGGRDAGWAQDFMWDLTQRLRHRVQLTTLVKMYGEDKRESIRQYSPGHVIGCQLAVINGKPDPWHISTSFIERQNLTMRMQMRRFTRLTNGFSKKVENLRYAVALHFMNYNFCRVHQTLKRTPAMAAGISDHIWKLEEIVELLKKSENSN